MAVSRVPDAIGVPTPITLTPAPAPTFEQIKPKIDEVLKGKIIVGHAVFNDLAVSTSNVDLQGGRDGGCFCQFGMRAIAEIGKRGDERPG